MADLGTDVIKSTLDELRREGHIVSTINDNHYDAIRDTIRRSVPLMQKFVPQRFRGNLLLFVPAEDEGRRPIEIWRTSVDGKIEVHPIDCTHETMMEPLPAAKIGGVLAAELAIQLVISNSISKEKQHGYQSV